MARTRDIKPEFFKDRPLCKLPPFGRLLFAALWTIADRNGLIEDEPERIKIDTLPYDDCDVDNLLEQLAESKFVIRYTIGERHVLQIVNFHKHQNPHPKEVASDLPFPDGTVASLEERSRGKSRQNAVKSGKVSSIPSLPFVLDLQAPVVRPSKEPPAPEPWAEYTPVWAKAETLPTVRHMRQKASDMDNVRMPAMRFEEFWNAYPRQVNKDDACRAWVDVVFADEEEDLFACLKSYAQSAEVARNAIYAAGNWLRKFAKDKWKSRWPSAVEATSRKGPVAVERKRAEGRRVRSLLEGEEASNG